jgi:hypothetical protein
MKRKPPSLPQTRRRLPRHRQQHNPHRHLEEPREAHQVLPRQSEGHRRRKLLSQVPREAARTSLHCARRQPNREPPAASPARSRRPLQGEGHSHHRIQPSWQHGITALQGREGQRSREETQRGTWRCTSKLSPYVPAFSNHPSEAQS